MSLKLLTSRCASFRRTLQIKNKSFFIAADFQTRCPMKDSLLEDINKSKNLSSLHSLLQKEKKLMTEEHVFAAMKFMSKVFQQQFTKNPQKIQKDCYSKLFSLLTSIIDDMNPDVNDQEEVQLSEKHQITYTENTINEKSTKISDMDFEILVALLQNATKTEQQSDTVQQIAKKLIEYLNVNELSVQEALPIFYSLCAVKKFSKDCDILLKKIFGIFVSRTNEFNQLGIAMNSVASEMRNRVEKQGFENFYQPKVLNAFANQIINSDTSLEITSNFLIPLADFRHENKSLLNYACNKFIEKTSGEQPLTAQSLHAAGIIARNCESMNYMPSRLEEMHKIIDQNSDTGDIDSLKELMDYAISTKRPNEVLENIIQKLLESREEMNAHQALGFLYNLFKQNTFSNFEALLEKIYGALVKNCGQLDNSRIQCLFSVLRSKKLYKFYNPLLFDALLDKLVEKEADFVLVKSCLNSASACRHYNVKATDYVFDLFVNKGCEMDLTRQQKFGTYAEIMKILAIMRHKPPGWEKIHDLIDLSEYVKSLDVTMLRALTLNMATLDYFHPVLLEQLLNDKSNTANNKSFYLYFLKLLQKIQVSSNYNGPSPTSKQLEMLKDMGQLKRNKSSSMIGHLEKILGGENFVKTDLKTKLHHLIDYVVCYDSKGIPIQIQSDEEEQCLENLHVPTNSIIICVLYLPEYWFFRNTAELLGTEAIYVDTLEALSNAFKVVTICDKTWTNLPDAERTEFLRAKLKEKLFDSNKNA